MRLWPSALSHLLCGDCCLFPNRMSSKFASNAPSHLFLNKPLYHAWPWFGRARMAIAARRELRERRKIEKSSVFAGLTVGRQMQIAILAQFHLEPHTRPQQNQQDLCFKALNINAKHETFVLHWVEWLVNSQSPHIIQITRAIWHESWLD